MLERNDDTRMSQNPYRHLPSVHDVLESSAVRDMHGRHAHADIVGAIREEISGLRKQLGQAEMTNGAATAEAVGLCVVERLQRELRPKLRPVINATGIVLHTNLGRAPMAEAAAQAAYQAARGYLNLELDLDSGKRSSRQDPIREVLQPLLGCESATAVNNCAAATVITLRALAAGKEVVVSR